VQFGASRAFCPQYAWVQNATIRENITFGKPYDRAWYDTVVDACCLRPDLEIFPNGDQTEVGERGITVSGGQKQRLNIARAIYFDADIVLMDDPLSAVDAHVGRQMMDNAICGLLKDKCRVLATHQLWVLNRCDRIIWLENGSVHAMDTFDNLMANNTEFQHLMATTAAAEEMDKQSEAEDAASDEEEAVVEEKGATGMPALKRKKSRKAPALMQAEEKQVKSVPWSVYADYVRASGSLFNAVIVIALLILSQGANITTSLWLSWWTSDKWGYSTGAYIGGYAALGFAQSILMFSFSVALTVLGTEASRKMLNRAIHRALRAPMSFFDTTPLGRITNRFSRDVDTMDNNLTDAMRMYLFTIAMITSVFILIIAYFHYVSIPSFPLLT
jgi:ABC-type multidrug transport system fused ATPase/permease subunit